MAPSSRASRKDFTFDQSLYADPIDTPQKLPHPAAAADSSRESGTSTAWKRSREDLRRASTSESEPASPENTPKRPKQLAAADIIVEEEREGAEHEDGTEMDGLRTPRGRTRLHPTLHELPDPRQNFQVDLARTPSYMRDMVAERSGEGSVSGGNSRRLSLESRGKRGSNIGTGFEAAPHPSIPPRLLFRHISATAPPVVRLRLLIYWIACYQRYKLLKIPVTEPEKKTNVEFVKPTVDAFTKQLSKLEMDVSWVPARDADPSTVQDGSTLVDHPLNIANRGIWDKLEGEYSDIAAERAARKASRMQKFELKKQALTRQATERRQSEEIRQAWLDATPPVFKNAEDIMSYGRLMESEDMPMNTGSKPGEAPRDPSDLRVDAMAIQRTTRNIRQFATLLETYIAHRRALTNTQLAALASSGTGHSADRAGDIAPAVRGLPPVHAAMSEMRLEEPVELRKEQRDLLKAIAKGDTSGRAG